MRNLMQTEQLGQSRADKLSKERTIQNYNKAVSELRTKQRKEEPTEMEKQQEIPLATIFNTIHNIKISDAEEEFEEVPPLPGNSSFVPVPLPAATIKKPAGQVVTVGEKTKGRAEVREEIEEEIAGEEELEEYYDDDFEEYVEPSASQKIELKRESEDVASYYEDYLQVALD